MRGSRLVPLLLVAAACGEEAPPEVLTVRFDPPRFESLADPAWSPRTSPEDPVVATVGQAQITLSAVQRQVDLGAGEVDGPTALERLIEAELLAQEARRLDMATAPEVLRALKHEAVRHLLHTRFIDELGPEEVDRRDVDQAFRIPQVRIRYDHEDGYFVRDVQIVCCVGAPEQCRDNADPDCFDKATPVIQAVYQVLEPQQPFADEAAFVAAIEKLQLQYPQLAMKEHSFWYEQGVPYKEQHKYTRFFTDWVEAIVDLPGPGSIAAPIRSYHAWHIPMLVRHEPAVHRTPDEPQVRTEIAQGILPAIRKRAYQKWMHDRLTAYQVQETPKMLELLGPRAESVADGEPAPE